jgi:hypothetical protein
MQLLGTVFCLRCMSLRRPSSIALGGCIASAFVASVVVAQCNGLAVVDMH